MEYAFCPPPVMSMWWLPSGPPIRLEQTRAVQLHGVLDEDSALQVGREEVEGHQGVVEVPMRVIAGKDDRLLGMHHPQHLQEVLMILRFLDRLGAEVAVAQQVLARP